MTAQAPERIILDGQETSMTSCPEILADHPRIESVPMDEVAEAIRSGSIQGSVLSTACWRKYIATWEIREGRLYLVSIEGIYRLTGEGPLHASWVSGVLRVPRGRMTRYVHMGFESEYEKELLITVERGVVKEMREADGGAMPKPSEPIPPPGRGR